MSVMETFGWVLAGVGAVLTIGWLIGEMVAAPTEVEDVPLADMFEDDTTAAEADVHPSGFTRAGWNEYAPGYWVRDVPHAENECALEEIPGFDPVFAGEVLADIDDLPVTAEEAQ